VSDGFVCYPRIVRIRMKQIWLRGPNGVGKSTLGKMIEAKISGSVFVSSGNLLRQSRDIESQVTEDMGEGNLAKSDIVLRVMGNRFKELKHLGTNLLVVDGFPRKVEELRSWIRMTQAPDVVISLNLSDHEIVERLINRQVCDKCGESYNSFSNIFLRPIVPRVPGRCDACSDGQLVRRPDDVPDIILKRLSVFRANEQRILSSLREQAQVKFATYDVAKGLSSFETIVHEVPQLIR
jgi:adenylate kinase